MNGGFIHQEELSSRFAVRRSMKSFETETQENGQCNGGAENREAWLGDDDLHDAEHEPLVVVVTTDSNGGDGGSLRQSSGKHPSGRSSRASSLSDYVPQGCWILLLFLAGGLGLRVCVLQRSAVDSGVMMLVEKELLYADPDRPIPGLDGAAMGKIRSVNSLRRRFQAAKDAYLQQLRTDYGEYYNAMFVHGNITVGRLAFRSGSLDSALIPESFANSSGKFDMGPSWDRLKRKVLMKMLQAQMIAAKKPRKKSKGSSSEEATPLMPTFVWTSGGHSASAAHGDLYNESYAAVMERAVRPVLSELGVWFQARNYGMGGTGSAAEVALCHVPIFGTDIDAISWDFGMMEPSSSDRMEMYFRQASMNPSRPASLAMVIGGFSEGARQNVMRHLEDSGISAMYMPRDVDNAVLSGIPDSFGLSDAELQSMPAFVEKFKCEGKIEGNDPCNNYKFTVIATCPQVKSRVSWHPGWRWHAMMGNVLALSMLEVVEDALADLETLDLPKDAASVYRELRLLEDQEYEAFAKSNTTGNFEYMVNDGPDQLDEGVDLVSYLFKKRPYCHTARLPAEARYSGILTETHQTGFFHYDTGISKQEAQSEANNSTGMRLVYDAGERQFCNELLQVDYKDFFYVGETEGAKSLTLPNDAELRAYGTGQPIMGIIGFTPAACEWGCPKEVLTDSGLDQGEWEMSINGLSITGRVKVVDTSFVRHKDGWVFPPNADGRFEIQARVNATGKHLRLSSIMIF